MGSLTLTNNIFENVFGNNQGRSIRITKLPNSNIIIRNNTIKNCPAGGPFIYLGFSNEINELTIESVNFIENFVSNHWDSNSDSLMTPQVWIANTKNGQYGSKFDLIFNNCYFKKNVKKSKYIIYLKTIIRVLV